MAEIVQLNEVSHNASMMKGFNEMRKNRDLCDFMIKVGKDEYSAHRIVLAAASNYFRAKLKPNTMESKLGVVEITDMDSESVKSCIDYIYTARIAIPGGKIKDLLQAAQAIQLDEVSSVIIERLKNSLSVANYFSTRNTARSFKIGTLQLQCKRFERENLLLISAEPEFQNEDKSHIIDILNSKKMSLKTQDKLTVLINWTGRMDERKGDLFNLLKIIDLTKIPAKYLWDLLKNDPIISADFNLYKILSEVIMKRNYLDKESTNGDIEGKDNSGGKNALT